MSDYPTIQSITKIGSMAGRVTYQVKVKYPHEPIYTVLFHGGTYADDPVVMQHQNSLGNDVQEFVSDHQQYGTFGPEWVRRFFGKEA